MAKSHFMEIGNFVCRFGEDAVLMDFYNEIVEPAFFGEYERTYGDTRYIIIDVKLVDIGTPASAIPAIAGRIVKDTFLHQEQRLVDGVLVPADATLESAPSSFFVLVLPGHRLLFTREHRGSPDMSQFATTIERFMKYARRDRVADQYSVARAKGEPTTKRALGQALPMPSVTVTPVLSQESVDEFIDRFSVLKCMRITLAPVNQEPDLNQFFSDFRAQKESIAAQNAQIEYRGTRGGGLRTDPVKEQVKSAVEGNATFTLEGIDRQQRPLRGDNDNFKMKVEIEPGTGPTGEEAARLGGAYRSLVQSGAVSEGPAVARNEATLRALVARLR